MGNCGVYGKKSDEQKKRKKKKTHTTLNIIYLFIHSHYLARPK